MKKYIAVLLLLTIPFMQGCIALGLMALGTGAGVGMGRAGTAKIMKAKGEYTEKYNNYRIELEKINLEREKSGLKSVNIPTFEEWLDTQPLTATEIKLFKKYKASTTEDLKGQDRIHRQMENLKAKETKEKTATTAENTTKQ